MAKDTQVKTEFLMKLAAARRAARDADRAYAAARRDADAAWNQVHSVQAALAGLK